MRLLRRRRSFGAQEEPMAGLTNLADVMLVFAVAVMLLALVRWHVTLEGVPVVRLDPDTLVQVEDLEVLTMSDDGMGGSGHSEQVYMDPKTGQMFIVK
jgi:hypothetical protein